jgi:hypothetical protein
VQRAVAVAAVRERREREEGGAARCAGLAPALALLWGNCSTSRQTGRRHRQQRQRLWGAPASKVCVAGWAWPLAPL